MSLKLNWSKVCLIGWLEERRSDPDADADPASFSWKAKKAVVHVVSPPLWSCCSDLWSTVNSTHTGMVSSYSEGMKIRRKCWHMDSPSCSAAWLNSQKCVWDTNKSLCITEAATDLGAVLTLLLHIRKRHPPLRWHGAQHGSTSPGDATRDKGLV